MTDATNVPITREVDDMSRIDARLAEIYREAAGAPGAEAVPIVRIALSNLVVYASTETLAEQALADVSTIVGEHPCRAIVVDALPPTPTEGPVTVSVMCGITDRGDRLLCGEVIRLHVHEDGGALVGSVMPLLTSGVPVVLWVPGDFAAANDPLTGLLPVASRVIVDSRRAADLSRGLDWIAGLAYPQRPGLGVQDLAWVSLQPWREMTAQHFDPPAMRSCADRIERVTVRHGGHAGGTPAGALLLASWLLDRTGCLIESSTREPDALAISARQGDNPVEVRLIREPSPLSEGQVTQVSIVCSSPGGEATFTTTATSATQISISEECRGACYPPRTLGMPVQGDASLVAAALDQPARDPVYACALDLARQALRS